jgi:hypothetical protein
MPADASAESRSELLDHVLSEPGIKLFLKNGAMRIGVGMKWPYYIAKQFASLAGRILAILVSKEVLAMSKIGNKLVGKVDRKIAPERFVHAIRSMVFMLAAEAETVKVYANLAELIDSKEAAKLARNIMDEKHARAEEILMTLNKLAPDKREVVGTIPRTLKWSL